MKNLLFILFLFPSLALAQTTISTAQIRDGAVTYVKFQQLPGLTMFGRSTNTTGTGESITAGLDGHLLRRSGTTLSFGALDLSSANSTTGTLSFAKLASGTLISSLTVTGNANNFTFTGIPTFTIGADNIHLDAATNINIDASGDVLLNGVAGTSGEFVGNVDGHLVWSVPPGGGSSSSGVLDVNTSTVGNVGAGEDVLWTYTMPGDTLSVDEQGILIRIAGSSTVNGNNKRIRLYFGDDLIVDPGINNLTLTWSMDCQVIRVNGTTLKSNCQVVTIGSGQTHTVLDDITETLSGSVVIQLTGEAVADNDIIKESATVIRMEGGGTGTGVGGGDLSLSDFVVSETPTGTVNGVNDTFTLANTPAAFIHIYLDGLLQDEGGGNDYTISGVTITFVEPPLTGSKIRVSYIK